MMRLLAFALIVVAGACSAVDDFSRFHFGNDGGNGSGGGGGIVANDLSVGKSDGGPADAAPPSGPDIAQPLPTFGDPCGTDCVAPYTCYHLGAKDTMGICSRTCVTTNTTACLDLGASCVTVEGTTLCMPNCGLTQPCRSDLACCANMKTSAIGVCAPPMTDFCGKG